MRQQCATCPHAKVEDIEHVLFFPEFPTTPHPCHEDMDKPCVGHCQDLKKRMPVVKRTVYTIFKGRDHAGSLAG